MEDERKNRLYRFVWINQDNVRSITALSMNASLINRVRLVQFQTARRRSRRGYRTQLRRAISAWRYMDRPSSGSTTLWSLTSEPPLTTKRKHFQFPPLPSPSCTSRIAVGASCQRLYRRLERSIFYSSIQIGYCLTSLHQHNYNLLVFGKKPVPKGWLYV